MARHQHTLQSFKTHLRVNPDVKSKAIRQRTIITDLPDTKKLQLSVVNHDHSQDYRLHGSRVWWSKAVTQECAVFIEYEQEEGDKEIA